MTEPNKPKVWGARKNSTEGVLMFEQLHDAHRVVGRLLIIVAMTMLMAPLFRYVLLGWRAKKKDIMDGLDTSALHAYFEMFTRGTRPAQGFFGPIIN